MCGLRGGVVTSVGFHLEQLFHRCWVEKVTGLWKYPTHASCSPTALRTASLKTTGAAGGKGALGGRVGEGGGNGGYGGVGGVGGEDGPTHETSD